MGGSKRRWELCTSGFIWSFLGEGVVLLWMFFLGVRRVESFLARKKGGRCGDGDRTLGNPQKKERKKERMDGLHGGPRASSSAAVINHHKRTLSTHISLDCSPSSKEKPSISAPATLSPSLSKTPCLCPFMEIRLL